MHSFVGILHYNVKGLVGVNSLNKLVGGVVGRMDEMVDGDVLLINE